MHVSKICNVVSLLAFAGCWSVTSLAQGPVAPDFTVGRNLQASGSIQFGSPVPEGGMEIEITSEEPDRILFSARMTEPGTPSIKLKCPAGMRQSPEFWVHGLDDGGTANYVVSSPAFGTLKGAVNLSPSAVLIMGPYRAPTFRTTPRSAPSRITLYSVRLDADHKFVEEQAVAGGMKLPLELDSSDPGVGTLNPTSVSIEGGSGSAVSELIPAGVGSTTISVSVPPGFTQPAEHAAITAMVNIPGIALTQDLVIGQNLQVMGMVGLGEPAPPGGVKVTLTSDNPERLLLSTSLTEVGSREVTLTIAEGKVSAPVCLQSLVNSGSATYTAAAAGYRSRSEPVAFAPSGVVVMVKPYGPPDEAELLRPHAGSVTGGVFTPLSKKLPLAIWMVQLDPQTLRGADITVQPLRAGMKLQVALENSDPRIGKVDSPVTIAAGEERATAEFIPKTVGSTTISVVTPAGFTKVANSTCITATVTR